MNCRMNSKMEHVEHINSHLRKKGSCFASRKIKENNVSGMSIDSNRIDLKDHLLSYNGKTYINHPDTTFNHGLTSLGNINNKVLAVGGSSANENHVEIFDIDTDNWTTKTEFPFCSR